MVSAIDKAIRTSGTGLNPMSDGTVVRVPVPPMTEERRRSSAMLAELFEFYIADPSKLPESYVELLSDTPAHRVVCDYIAGMTDGFFQKIWGQIVMSRSPKRSPERQ